jgi:hypothetical protein
MLSYPRTATAQAATLVVKSACAGQIVYNARADLFIFLANFSCQSAE